MQNTKYVVTPDGVGRLLEDTGYAMTRREIAQHFGRDRATTHIITQIEVAVDGGQISKFPATANGRDCWAYCAPNVMQSLFADDLPF